ncbi:MAG: EAL domain-containing protein [Desulfobacterales bacterium]|nr:EAL domain-containing protein [Desulfobacterales bacterium]
MEYSEHERKRPLALVVDDDLPTRLTISAALKNAGLDVVEADTGCKGVDCFISDNPDIILMDALMPDMDGFGACEQIRKLPQGKYTQILMVTGLDDTESTRKAFEKGANGFVTKPLNLIMLGQRVNYMLKAGAAFKELHASRNRLAKTQELALIGNWQFDFSTGKLYCSEETCKLIGIPNYAQPSIESFFSTVVPEDKKRAHNIFIKSVETHTSIATHYRIECPEGTLKHILQKAEIVHNENGLSTEMLGIVQDVTQLKKAEDEIRFLAFSDSLTGLANRLLFMDRLDQTILESARNRKTFALLFLDLDHFKRVNDTLGHHIGDLLLKEVADTIQVSIRKNDSAMRIEQDVLGPQPLIARLGGDEFTILLSDLENPASAAIVARRLLDSIPKTHTLEGHQVSISTSIGISVFPDDGDSAEQLLKKADTAMYDAKKNGRNGYQFFKQTMNTETIYRYTIGMDLKKALENDEFYLVYQPKVRMSDKKIVGAEALIRWNHPEQGVLYPELFIPIAEESNTIIEINRWVLETACRQSKKWMDRMDSPMKIAINLSGFKLGSQQLISTIDQIIQTHRIDPELIEIEITENVLMQHSDTNVEILTQLKERKIKIAIDDFGTGYSSLSYLTSFPVDAIKIDKSFISDMSESNKSDVIIKAIVAMGRSLDKTVIAEGIETETQYKWLKEMGCDEAQGFFFSHPLKASQLSDLLQYEY